MSWGWCGEGVSIHSPPKELHIKFQHSSMSEVLFIIGGHNVPPPPRANRYSQTLGLVGLSEALDQDGHRWKEGK